jgi:hypothetical protein
MKHFKDLNDRQKALVRFVRENDGALVDDLKSPFKMSANDIRASMQLLIKHGFVSKKKHKGVRRTTFGDAGIHTQPYLTYHPGPNNTKE